MRLETNVLLEEGLGRRLIVLGSPIALLAEELFDGVSHGIRFRNRFGFCLDAEPSRPAGGITDVPHGSLLDCSTTRQALLPRIGKGDALWQDPMFGKSSHRDGSCDPVANAMVKMISWDFAPSETGRKMARTRGHNRCRRTS